MVLCAGDVSKMRRADTGGGDAPDSSSQPESASGEPFAAAGPPPAAGKFTRLGRRRRVIVFWSAMSFA